VLGDDSEAVVDEIARLHFIRYFRDTQRTLEFFVRRQIENVIFGKAWNIERLVLVGVQCYSIQTYLKLA